MAGYHRFVFDTARKKFIGKFEEMYKTEDIEGYDSWHSFNLNTLPKKIHYSLLSSYNFGRILDFDCGKGSFTHLLKKSNNYVLGLDISETAIAKAKQYFGNIQDFRVIKNNDFKSVIGENKFDLTITLEALSYVKNWPKVIKDISEFSSYLYIALYIPPKPIGFVKSFRDLTKVSSRYFHILEKLIYNDESIFLFLENKK